MFNSLIVPVQQDLDPLMVLTCTAIAATMVYACYRCRFIDWELAGFIGGSLLGGPALYLLQGVAYRMIPCSLVFGVVLVFAASVLSWAPFGVLGYTIAYFWRLSQSEPFTAGCLRHQCSANESVLLSQRNRPKPMSQLRTGSGTILMTMFGSLLELPFWINTVADTLSRVYASP